MKKPFAALLIVLLFLLLAPVVWGQQRTPSSPATSGKRSTVATPYPSPTPSPVVVNIVGPLVASPSNGTDPAFFSVKGFPWTVLAAAGAIVAALIAWNTAERNRAQERTHFARKELQDQFFDIQNRIEAETPFVRANAALAFAQFAERVAPQAERKFRRTRPAPRNIENNPYFKPIIQLLANALYLEPDAAVRRSVVEALQNLTSFAGDTAEKSDELLGLSVATLASANKAALAAFLESVAAWEASSSATKGEAEKFDFLGRVAGFCNDSAATQTCLRLLLADEEETTVGLPKTSAYEIQRQVAASRRSRLQEAERSADDALRLPAMETAARQLKDTRDALATALRSVPDPGEKRRQFYQLRKCFLAGANLCGARLQKINFSESHLGGANLWFAHLDWAEFSNAHIQGANLSDVYAGRAIFTEANLEGADLRGADLKQSFMKGTLLYGVHFNETAPVGRRITALPDSTLEFSILKPSSRAIRNSESSTRTQRLRAWLTEQKAAQEAKAGGPATPPAETPKTPENPTDSSHTSS